MTLQGIANSKDLDLLVGVLDQHCMKRGITNEADRQNAAAILMGFFNSGIGAAEDLSAALARTADREDRNQLNSPAVSSPSGDASSSQS